MRLVVYIDGILIMEKSKELADEHTAALVFLPMSLGFILSEMSVTNPSQRIEFLGLVVDASAMKLQMPGEKTKKI